MQVQKHIEIRMSYLTLLLLAEGPKYAYELLRGIRQVLSKVGVNAPSPGTLYPLLKKLEEAGYIQSGSVNGHKVYKLTEKGWELLTEMTIGGLQMVASLLDIYAHILRRHHDIVKKFVSNGAIVNAVESIRRKINEILELLEKNM